MRLLRRQTYTDVADRQLFALEDALRRYRPTAPSELVRAIAGPTPVETTRIRMRAHVALAAIVTLLLLSSLAAVGGVSYAANAITRAAEVASGTVVTHAHVVGMGITAGGDQYKPGYGFGDENHNHSGPPGIESGKPGEKAPPTQVVRTTDSKAVLATGQITVDEQAALYFSVLDSKGNQLLLTQRGSRIGDAVEGPQVKTIHYVMLVPRTIPVKIRVPANLLQKGQSYRIRIIAVDAQGNKTRTFINFTA
jgi:hypothetical protein